MPKVSLDQRRLDVLRQQLYGSPHKITKNQQDQNRPDTQKALITADMITRNAQAFNRINTPVETGTMYLRQDLTKIFVLSFLALTVQLLLYWSLRMNLIHLGF
ncbi:hypothetical protein HYW46_04895 [Candidatus Daviesbacteria bacterium]|nr:hypothetical protein [Candidatus Daviesbacteria bacterium]